MKAIVLAAGENKRFWPLGQIKHKSLYKVGFGRPIIDYTLESLFRSGIEEAIVVVRPQDKEMRRYLEGVWADERLDCRYLRYLVQSEPKGTGQALLNAASCCGLENEKHFLLLNASQINVQDVVYEMTRSGLLRRDAGGCFDCEADMILTAQRTDCPQNYGVICLDQNGQINGVHEKPETFISSLRIVGVYLLSPLIFEELSRRTGEDSLEQSLHALVRKKLDIRPVVLPQEMKLFSLKYPWDLLGFNRHLMTLWRPEKFDRWEIIGHNIKYGEIEMGEGVRIIGHGVTICRGVKIGANAVIKGPCFIDEGAIIGDCALVRDCSYIGRNAIVGAHCEVKNSLIYDDVHLHRNFIGDSILGEDCHLGAGTITANKRLDRQIVKSKINGEKVETGLAFLGVIMGEKSSTGINVNLMPGAKIGVESQVEAGATVSQDVPDQVLFYQKPTGHFQLISHKKEQPS